jgi:type IV secretion system protein VirD4
MIRRPISLVLCLIAGYFLGNMLTWLVLAPVAGVMHLAAGPILTIASVGSLLGMLAGFFLWRRRPAPTRSSAVHGSARWSTSGEIRAALGGSEGLIVGHENTKAGQLLRYAGQQHLITIAPTRSGKGVSAIIPIC